MSECVSIITHSRKHRVQKRKNLHPPSILKWLAIKWGYTRTRDTSPLRRAGAGAALGKPFEAQTARESGVLSTGGVAPSLSPVSRRGAGNALQQATTAKGTVTTPRPTRRGLADPEKSVVTNTKNGRFVTLSRKNLLTFLLQIAVKRAVANKLAVIRRKDEVHKWTRSKTRSF